QQLAHLELTLEALDGHRIAHDVRVQHLDGAVAPLDHVEGFVHAPHAPVGHYPPDLVAPEQHLPDPGVLGVAGDRDLGGAHQLLSVRRTEPGIGRVQAPANRTGLHSVHSPRHRSVPRLKHTTISGAAVTVGGFRLCGVEARRLGVDDPVAHRALPEIFAAHQLVVQHGRQPHVAGGAGAILDGGDGRTAPLSNQLVAAVDDRLNLGHDLLALFAPAGRFGLELLQLFADFSLAR